MDSLIKLSALVSGVSFDVHKADEKYAAANKLSRRMLVQYGKNNNFYFFRGHYIRAELNGGRK
jgi:hypothetical protein